MFLQIGGSVNSWFSATTRIYFRDRRQSQSTPWEQNPQFPTNSHFLLILFPQMRRPAGHPKGRNQETKNSLKIKFWAGYSWDIRDPDVGISRTTTLCRWPMSVVLDREWPGCLGNWARTSRVWKNIMQENLGFFVSFPKKGVSLLCLAVFYVSRFKTKGFLAHFHNLQSWKIPCYAELGLSIITEQMVFWSLSVAWYDENERPAKVHASAELGHFKHETKKTWVLGQVFDDVLCAYNMTDNARQKGHVGRPHCFEAQIR